MTKLTSAGVFLKEINHVKVQVRRARVVRKGSLRKSCSGYTQITRSQWPGDVAQWESVWLLFVRLCLIPRLPPPHTKGHLKQH
jgi:hypothetical protein